MMQFIELNFKQYRQMKSKKYVQNNSFNGSVFLLKFFTKEMKMFDITRYYKLCFDLYLYLNI